MTEAFTRKPSVHRPPHAPATAADVMRPALTTIEPGGHVAAATYLMKHAGVTALVVVDNAQTKQPVGIITETDIVQAVADGKDVNDVRIRALITTHPTVIDPTTSIRDAARSMVTGHVRHLPVAGEAGLIGMVDITAVCAALLDPPQDNQPASRDRHTRDNPDPTGLTEPPNKNADAPDEYAADAARKRNPTPDHAAGLLAEDVVFHSPALDARVSGWDTLGGPDPGTFDKLGRPDRRTGEDHPAGPGGQRAPQHHSAHHQLLHPGPAHPGRPAITYPSLLVAHVVRFLDTAAAFT